MLLGHGVRTSAAARRAHDHQESYVLANTPSTWGLESHRNNVSNEDGVAVRRFREAGAHFVGKTNVPVDLADFQSYNPVYGTTNNPWNVERTPGGSSGGSAASLAAGFAALEAGSDIGGSIRTLRTSAACSAINPRGASSP